MLVYLGNRFENKSKAVEASDTESEALLTLLEFHHIIAAYLS